MHRTKSVLASTKKMIEILLDIGGTGGVLMQNDIVIRTSKELEHMQGWSREHLDVHCKENNLQICVLRMYRQADLFDEASG